jgi:hypothetical protein
MYLYLHSTYAWVLSISNILGKYPNQNRVFTNPASGACAEAPGLSPG